MFNAPVPTTKQELDIWLSNGRHGLSRKGQYKPIRNSGRKKILEIREIFFGIMFEFISFLGEGKLLIYKILYYLDFYLYFLELYYMSARQN